MQARLKHIHSPDEHDLSLFAPSGPFTLFLQLMVGADGLDGEESFDLVVSSFDWLETQPESIMFGRHQVYVREWRFSDLEARLRREIENVRGATWNEIAEKLSRIGHWEFEDYQS